MSVNSAKFVSNTNSSSPSQPLFRKQAIEHQSTRLYGTVTLVRPMSYSILTGLFLTIVFAIIVFFTLFSTTRTTQSRGVLLPSHGVIRVVPSLPGTIAEVRVKEGQFVHAGDVLFVMSGERSSTHAGAPQQVVSNLLKSRRDSFQTELQQSRLQVDTRMSAGQVRANNLADEVARLDDQIALQEHRIVLAEQSYKRFSDLNATSYISSAQLQDKQAELLDQQQRQAELRRMRAASKRELANAEADVRDLQVQSQRDAAGIQRSLSSVEQDLTESEARREFLVRASQDGVVTAITGQLGQRVMDNSVLAAILPKGAKLEAEIYVPSRSIGFIKPDMPVLLRYEAFPYQKFGQHQARVRDISLTSLRPEELFMPSSVSGVTDEPMYRIRLTLQDQSILAYGEKIPLKSGMLVGASVKLEKRRLYEWVLEPLFSISGRL